MSTGDERRIWKELRMTRFTSLALAAAVLAGALAPIAAPARSENAVRVSYSDLDLSSSDGRAVLTRHLRRAADTLCGAGKIRDLAVLTACRTDVLAGIRPSIQLALEKSAVRVARIDTATARALR